MAETHENAISEIGEVTTTTRRHDRTDKQVADIWRIGYQSRSCDRVVGEIAERAVIGFAHRGELRHRYTELRHPRLPIRT